MAEEKVEVGKRPTGAAGVEYDFIQAMVDANKAKPVYAVTEREFIDLILPELRPDENGETPAPKERTRICRGRVSEPIYVLDDKTRQLLFRVPPILLPSEMPGPKSNTVVTFPEVLATYEKIRLTQGEGPADAYLAVNGPSHMPQASKPMAMRYLADMAYIYYRYDLPMKDLVGEYADEVSAMFKEAASDGQRHDSQASATKSAPEIDYDDIPMEEM